MIRGSILSSRDAVWLLLVTQLRVQGVVLWGHEHSIGWQRCLLWSQGDAFLGLLIQWHRPQLSVTPPSRMSFLHKHSSKPTPLSSSQFSLHQESLFAPSRFSWLVPSHPPDSRSALASTEQPSLTLEYSSTAELLLQSTSHTAAQ